MKKSVVLVLWGMLAVVAPTPVAAEPYSAYLFAYFTGNGANEEQIHFAVSDSGLSYRALNNDDPIIDSAAISTSGGVRDPHILRGADGTTFYMVVTDLKVSTMGWSNYALVLMKSTDLINWQSTVINIPDTYPTEFGGIHRVWAPQTIYDDATGKYMVYFSMKTGTDPDKIYYAYANASFTAFEAAPQQLFFSPTNSACIDADIIKKDGQFYMFHKSESGSPGIKLAISSSLTSGYTLVSDNRVDKSSAGVEGSCVFQLIDSGDWILMYDVYTQGRYEFTRSTDLQNFELIGNGTAMNFFPRHGTVIPITDTELQQLKTEWWTDVQEPVSLSGAVARWDFENGTANTAYPGTNQAVTYRADVPDSTGNGNHLSVFGSTSAISRTNVPPVVSGPNSLSVQNGNSNPSMFTWSAEGNPGVTDLETAVFDSWTIEAFINSTGTGAHQTFIGRDGYATQRAPLYFKIRNNGGMRLMCEFTDMGGFYHPLTGSRLLSNNRWYYVAVVSDGTTLTLYSADLTAGETVATVDGTPLNMSAISDDTRLGPWPDYSPASGTQPNPRRSFSVGRGYYNHSDTDRFLGYIDEVRISSGALDIPTQGLLAQGVPVELSEFALE